MKKLLALLGCILILGSFESIAQTTENTKSRRKPPVSQHKTLRELLTEEVSKDVYGLSAENRPKAVTALSGYAVRVLALTSPRLTLHQKKANGEKLNALDQEIKAELKALSLSDAHISTLTSQAVVWQREISNRGLGEL